MPASESYFRQLWQMDWVVAIQRIAVRDDRSASQPVDASQAFI
jgi:hypothetical protein